MYESTIEIIYGAMKSEIEGAVYKAVQDVGIKVDKEELLRALMYDRQQYEKGFKDGMQQSREKQSHWIDNAGMYTCAHCGSEFGVMMNYCGGCGYRMDGDPYDTESV